MENPLIQSRDASSVNDHGTLDLLAGLHAFFPSEITTEGLGSPPAASNSLPPAPIAAQPKIETSESGTPSESSQLELEI